MASRSWRPHEEFDPSVTHLPSLLKNKYMQYIYFQIRLPGFILEWNFKNFEKCEVYSPLKKTIKLMHKVTKSNEAYPWQNWPLWHHYIVTMKTLKLATNILTLNKNSNTDSLTDNKNYQYLTESTVNATFLFKIFNILLRKITNCFQRLILQ